MRCIGCGAGMRMSRSTRIARRPGLYTDPLQARLSRSQRSVDCIIATSAALRELLRPPNGRADFGVEGHSALPATQMQCRPKWAQALRSSPAAPMFPSG
jgi:hypothetical protein